MDRGQFLGRAIRVVSHDNRSTGTDLQLSAPVPRVAAQAVEERLGGTQFGQDKLSRRESDLRHRRHRRDDEAVSLRSGQPQRAVTRPGD